MHNTSSPLRFSIAGLMAVVLVAAVAFAGLARPSPIWAGTVFTILVLGLLLGTLAAVSRGAESRSFWTGFGVFGWGYFLLAFSPAFGGTLHSSPPLVGYHTESPRDYLITTQLLAYLHGRITAARSTYVDWRDFQQVGHSFVTAVCAGFGGVVARYLFSRPASSEERHEKKVFLAETRESGTNRDV